MNSEQRHAEGESTKLAIVNRFHEMLENGIPVRKITVPALMDELPWSQATFYQYFNTISDVVMPLLLEMQEAAMERSRAWYKDDGRPLLVRLDESIVGGVDVFHAYGRVMKAIIDCAGQDETIYEMWTKLARYYEADIRNNIQSQQAAGHIRQELDAGTAANFLVYGSMWQYILHFGGPTKSPKKPVAETLIQVWRSILYLE